MNKRVIDRGNINSEPTRPAGTVQPETFKFPEMNNKHIVQGGVISSSWAIPTQMKQENKKIWSTRIAYWPTYNIQCAGPVRRPPSAVRQSRRCSTRRRTSKYRNSVYSGQWELYWVCVVRLYVACCVLTVPRYRYSPAESLSLGVACRNISYFRTELRNSTIPGGPYFCACLRFFLYRFFRHLKKYF